MDMARLRELGFKKMKNKKRRTDKTTPARQKHYGPTDQQTNQRTKSCGTRLQRKSCLYVNNDERKYALCRSAGLHNIFGKMGTDL